MKSVGYPSGNRSAEHPTYVEDEDIVRYSYENKRLITLIGIYSERVLLAKVLIMLNILSRKGTHAICRCNICSEEYLTKHFYSAQKAKIAGTCPSCSTAITHIKEVNQQALHQWFIYDKDTGNWTYRFNTKQGLMGEDATVVHSAGYLSVRVGGKDYLAHRLAFVYVTGSFPPDQVDHINQNKSDNSWANLRAVDNQTNHQNEPRSNNNTSGVTGVCLHKPTSKYRAYIMVNRKHIHLGLFDTVEEAKLAREEANIKYGFHPNHGNEVCVNAAD